MKLWYNNEPSASAINFFKMRSLYYCLTFAACLFFPLTAFSSENEIKVHVAVNPVVSKIEGDQYTIVCDTITKTISFNLQLMQKYALEKIDRVGESIQQVEDLRDAVKGTSIDNIIFGTL